MIDIPSTTGRIGVWPRTPPRVSSVVRGQPEEGRKRGGAHRDGQGDLDREDRRIENRPPQMANVWGCKKLLVTSKALSGYFSLFSGYFSFFVFC